MDELSDLRSALLRSKPPVLGPEDGFQAFQHHKLVATAVHRATGLDRRRSESETDAWVRYITSYFPDGRRDERTARVLFKAWRTSLLKRDTPGTGVVITHGQPAIHWLRDPNGNLCLNLENIWIDFAASVDAFIADLRTDRQRGALVIARFRKERWTVKPFVANRADLAAGATVMDQLASFGSSITVASARSVTGEGPPDRV